MIFGVCYTWNFKLDNYCIPWIVKNVRRSKAQKMKRESFCDSLPTFTQIIELIVKFLTLQMLLLRALSRSVFSSSRSSDNTDASTKLNTLKTNL